MADAKSGAALPLETADASGVSVDEQVAVLAAHTVAKETASLNEQIEALKAENATLTTEKAELADKLTVAEAAIETAKQEFAAFKTDLETKAEQAKVAEARKAEVAKVAPALLEGEEAKVAERVTRWTAMDEAAFTDYVAELASVAGAPKNSGEAGDSFSGESAMERKTKSAPEGTTANARLVLGLPKN